MSRYIDISAAIKRFKELYGEENTLVNCYNADWIISFLETLPTADVEEVKRGYWIDVPLNVYDDRYGMNKYNKRIKCSVCEYAMPYEYPRFYICPNCGAKMDGERKDEE